MAKPVPIPFLEKLNDDEPRLVVFEGVPYCVVKTKGEAHAFVASCSHKDRPIVPLRLKKGTIPCPHHGARFSPVTGECTDKCGNDVPEGMREVEIEVGPDGVPALVAKKKHRKLVSKKARKKLSKKLEVA